MKTLSILIGLVLLCTYAKASDSLKVFNGFQYLSVNGKWNLFDPASNSMYPVRGRAVTIKYVDNTSAETILQFETQHNLQLDRKAVTNYYHYWMNGSNDFFDELNVMKLDPIIDYVAVAHIFGHTPDVSIGVGGNNPIDQWHIARIKADLAWAINSGSPNVTVAVLDWGCQWNNPDLGPGFNNTVSNVYMNPGEDAWSDPNDPSTGNNLDGDANGLIDDWKGWDFYNRIGSVITQDNDVRSARTHGTGVAGVIAEKTHNINIYGDYNGIAGGDNSPGCKVLNLKIGDYDFSSNHEYFADNLIDEAIIYAVDKGAKIINMSFGWPVNTLHNDVDAAILYAHNHGVLLVAAAGNSGTGSNGSGPFQFPSTSPYVMAVGGTAHNDRRSLNATYGEKLSVSAPAEDIISTSNLTLGSESFSGTSFSSPIVAGVAALMISENDCLSPTQIQDIIEQTAEKVWTQPNGVWAAYNYNWNPNKKGHSKELGYGMVDALAAVQAAHDSKSANLDLYIKDVPNDFGYPTPNYVGSDQSPDIWIRNQPDGLINQQHQNPEYQSNSPVYVYVRITNKSCTTSLNTEQLSVYWSKASSWSSWPQNWDGTQPAVGDKIGTVTIPILHPGESVILPLTWTISDPNITTWHPCLLARIEGSTLDPITVHPGRLDLDVAEENNIALRNVTVVNNIIENPPSIGGVIYPNGGFVYLGNPLTTEEKYNFHFFVPNVNSGANDVTAEAEVRLIFDNDGWDFMKESGQLDQPGIRQLDNNTVLIQNPDVNFENLVLPPGVRFPVYVGFNFLVDGMTDCKYYDYKISQSFTATPEAILGTETFDVRKNERDPFDADAGLDRTVNPNDVVTLQATGIGEPAVYNWYDEEDSLIYTGMNMPVCAEMSQQYKLEVVSNIDGFKDYDQVQVLVRNGHIVNISPNPVNANVNITYQLENTSSAYIILTNSTFTISNNYIINIAESSRAIDMSAFPPGIYTAVLVCDGKITDAKSITKL